MPEIDFGNNNRVKRLKITDVDHDGYLKDYANGKCTVMFYATWCGHCHNAAPIYGKISRMARLQTPCLAVECDTDTNLVKRLTSSSGLEIKGYPTFAQYKNGKFNKVYNGSYSDPDAFAAFVAGG